MPRLRVSWRCATHFLYRLSRRFRRWRRRTRRPAQHFASEDGCIITTSQSTGTLESRFLSGSPQAHRSMSRPRVRAQRAPAAEPGSSGLLTWIARLLRGYRRAPAPAWGILVDGHPNHRLRSVQRSSRTAIITALGPRYSQGLSRRASARIDCEHAESVPQLDSQSGGNCYREWRSAWAARP